MDNYSTEIKKEYTNLLIKKRTLEMELKSLAEKRETIETEISTINNMLKDKRQELYDSEINKTYEEKIGRRNL